MFSFSYGKHQPTKDSPRKAHEKKPEFEEVLHGSRSYQLHEEKLSDQFSFFVLGCAGDGGGSQKAVADLMNQIAARPAKPKFVIVLGDNFYDYGIDSCISPAFKTHFYNVYTLDSLNIPFFI